MRTPRDDLRHAAKEVIDAAVAWAEQDFGDPGDLDAAAALADAVIAFRRAADRAGLALSDAVRGLEAA